MKVEVHGHRGSRGTHPENTLPGFSEARDAGCDYFEIDVHLSADDQVVVFHDDEVTARVCSAGLGAEEREFAPRRVRSLTLAELRNFEVGQRPDARHPRRLSLPGQRIPTLRETLEWKTREAPKLRLNLEIKRAEGSDLRDAGLLTRSCLDLLAEFGLMGETLVQSFDHTIVAQARALSPELRLSCLFEREADFAVVARDHQAQVAALHYSLVTQAVVDRCHALGIEVLPWTVNEPVEWDRLFGLGVRAVITDYPRVLIERLRAGA